MCEGIVAVERNREIRHSLCQALRLRQAAGSECDGRAKLRCCKAAIAVWKIAVEVDGSAKEAFGQLMVIRGGLPKMPEAALIGSPSVEAPLGLPVPEPLPYPCSRE